MKEYSEFKEQLCKYYLNPPLCTFAVPRSCTLYDEDDESEILACVETVYVCEKRWIGDRNTNNCERHEYSRSSEKESKEVSLINSEGNIINCELCKMQPAVVKIRLYYCGDDFPGISEFNVCRNCNDLKYGGIKNDE